VYRESAKDCGVNVIWPLDQNKKKQNRRLLNVVDFEAIATFDEDSKHVLPLLSINCLIAG